MKLLSILLISNILLYANNNNNITERLVTVEVQLKQLENTIDSRTSLLKEKQEIFIEQEKRLNLLQKKCDDSIEKIDSKISTMDQKFRDLYSRYNYGVIGVFSFIILVILFVCTMLNRSLKKLEDNYKNKIDDITKDAERKLNALVMDTDTKIRKYQSMLDNETTNNDIDSSSSTKNPF